MKKIHEQPVNLTVYHLEEGKPWPPGVKYNSDDKQMFVTKSNGEIDNVEYNDWIVQEPDGEHYYKAEVSFDPTE